MSFTNQDRCDRCGAQAYSRFNKDSLELIFCAHHARESFDNLIIQGFMLVESETVPA